MASYTSKLDSTNPSASGAASIANVTSSQPQTVSAIPGTSGGVIKGNPSQVSTFSLEFLSWSRAPKLECQIGIQ